MIKRPYGPLLRMKESKLLVQAAKEAQEKKTAEREKPLSMEELSKKN